LGQKKKLTSSAPAAEKHISEIKDALTNPNVFFYGVRAFLLWKKVAETFGPPRGARKYGARNHLLVGGRGKQKT